MPTVTFTRMHPELIEPMRADKAALGYMPTSAYQYCEAMRVASSHGWYVFPPVDIQLRWNGADVLYWNEGEWQPLTWAHLPGHADLWDRSCPEGYQGLAPPYLRALPATGAVQVWSGWLVEAEEGWSALVRPLVNVHRSSFYHCYEGVVEVDRFRPCPLFVNLQLKATDVPVRMSRLDPLFQVQAVRRENYGAARHAVRDGFAELSADDWAGFRQTVRTDRPDETHRLGDYGADVRKRAKCPMRDVDLGSSMRSG